MISDTFLFSIRSAVETMRRSGLNDVIIGTVVQDIRSASLNEEYRRHNQLLVNNPPEHDTCFAIAEKISL